MTMTPEELQRKVRQTDNDVQSIYELLTAMSIQQTRHLHRLDGLEERIDVTGATLHEKIDTVAASLDARIDGVETRLTERLDGLDGRFDGLEGRFDGLEASMAEVLSRLPQAD